MTAKNGYPVIFDGPNMVTLNKLEDLINQLFDIDQLIKKIISV